MILLADEDSKAAILISRLREAGHDVVSTQDLGKDSLPDLDVFALAQSLGRTILTRNPEDFLKLHEENLAKGHCGVLAIYQGADNEKNMSFKDIVQAISTIEAAGVTMANCFYVVNKWNWRQLPVPPARC